MELTVLLLLCLGQLLYAKDTTTWNPIPGGGRGLLMYDAKGPNFCFLFTADKLTASTDYSLIYYADQPNRFVNWGGNYPGAFIASGKSDKYGAICLMGSVNLGMNLPSPPDLNADPIHSSLGPGVTGAKVWLVPTSDYDKTACKVINWDPTKFLFDDSSRLVNYCDTDVLSTAVVMNYRVADDGVTVIFTATTLKCGSAYVDSWSGASKVSTVLNSNGYYVSTAEYIITGDSGDLTVTYSITMTAGKSDVHWTGTGTTTVPSSTIKLEWETHEIKV